MITLLRRCKQALFPDPLANCHAAHPILNQLARELDAIANRINRHQSNGVNEITGFFKAIAKVQDTDLIPKAIAELHRQKKYERIAGRMVVLSAHLRNAGRNPHGMNRTHKGKLVTDIDIWLGGIDGYFTKTVTYTKAHRHETEFYVAMNHQAEQFMQSHIGSMVAIIREFNAEMSA